MYKENAIKIPETYTAQKIPKATEPHLRTGHLAYPARPIRPHVTTSSIGTQILSPGFKASHRKSGFKPSSSSSAHPCTSAIPQHVSPATTVDGVLPLGHTRAGARLDVAGYTIRRQTSSSTTMTMRKNGKSMRYELSFVYRVGRPFCDDSARQCTGDKRAPARTTHCVCRKRSISVCACGPDLDVVVVCAVDDHNGCTWHCRVEEVSTNPPIADSPPQAPLSQARLRLRRSRRP